MQNKSYISNFEQKLLIGFFVCISLLFYFHLAETKIENYNRNVEIEQLEKTSQANRSKDKVSFGIFIHERFDLPEQLFWLNIFLLPCIFYLLWKRKLSYFICSTIINILTTSSLILWNINNYNAVLINEYFRLLSHSTALILAIASTVFVILQLATITRFVFEKNHAKISLR